MEEGLLDWAKHYLKARDAILRKIESIQLDNEKLVVKYKNGETLEHISVEKLSGLNELPDCGIITRNSKDNVEFLLKNWKKLAEKKKLSIIFANPKSQLETSWRITPYIHNKICDESALELGINSMASMVEFC